MAAALRSVAAAAINKGPPSSFFGPDQKNPVLQSLENEIQAYQSLMKKRASPGYRRSNDEAPSRVYSTLFELWNKYEPKLSTLHYQKKLLEMGDFLVSVKEFNLAQWQCYGRYLRHFGDADMEEITDVTEFKKIYFPGGFSTDDAGFTFRALMGKTICTYQSVRMTDSKLQNAESVEKCIKLLNFLRIVTQVILPKESLCWLVFNGTVHIYSISRHLMMLGHAARVLEYLLWACMCMESSVPLLSVRYLTWRTTLYTAVCQAYYDCKAGQHAESFARRALTKINELSELENMSNAPENVETHEVFRVATLKMAIMVYRRTVFETRRKPKGFLRPRNRANLKDAAQPFLLASRLTAMQGKMPSLFAAVTAMSIMHKRDKSRTKNMMWPRTQSEKLLVDMFEHVEGSAAQMLCLLESLSDSGRRTLLSSPPAPENEVEMLDVYAELFMAAQEIIAGGGGSQGNAPPQHPSDVKSQALTGVVKGKSLIELASKGEDGVPLSAVVRLVKLAYCYEQWESFDNMIDVVITALKEIDDPKNGPDEKALEILKAYDKMTARNKQRKLFATDEDADSQDGGLPLPPNHNKDVGLSQDEVMHLAEVLLSVVTGPYSQDEMDMDMVVDACLALWSKCKQVFQKFQTGSTDNPKYLQKMENPSKWIYVLDIVHQVMGWCGLSAVDPALTAEVALRLGLAFEASAALDSSYKRKSGRGSATAKDKLDFDDDRSVMSASVKDQPSAAAGSLSSFRSQSYVGRGAHQQLLQARDILELGLRNVSYARQTVAVSDSKAVADIVWAKELNEDLFKPLPEGDLETKKPAEDEDEKDTDENIVNSQSDATAVWSMVQDLHLELMFIYHRVCLKLTAFKPETKTKAPKPFKRRTCSLMEYASSSDLSQEYIETHEELLGNCNKNSLSKALLCMQKALALSNGGKPSKGEKSVLQEAKELIRKTQAEEKKLYMENNGEKETAVKKIPPAPVLLSRTDTTAVFRPAPFVPASNTKVAWYRIFARPATGSNVKVRLNDYYLPGSGEEVPASDAVMRVAGLSPGEKYVYAVAAYSGDGKLIGDSIGESTKPVLASHRLPVLLAWAFLCQVGYQTNDFEVSKEASQFLWSHFVAQPPLSKEETFVTEEADDFKLTLHRLNPRVVKLASPVLLRMFLNSIFIRVDINIREGSLFCEKLCDNGPLFKGQLGRLSQCEYMLVALELAGWLNETNLALQAVVQCYGLLAPLIYFQIPSTPVVQVLERCQAVLQEIPSHLRTRRQATISDSLHHMVACLTHSLAKVLRTWKQRALANNINDAGRKMLTAETEKERELRLDQLKAAENSKDKGHGTDPGRASVVHEVASNIGGRTSKMEGGRGTALGEYTDTGSMTLAALKKKKAGKKNVAMSGRDDSEIPGNEELKALEAHMLKLSKQGEHDLSGNEDPNILHAYIAYLPSKTAYKEVVKFKRRARYLEFFVQVAHKSLSEGFAESALEWCEDTLQWLNKRNDGILGYKSPQQKQQLVAQEKYAATVVEYSRNSTTAAPAPVPESMIEKFSQIGENKLTNRSQKKIKRPKYKAIGVTNTMTDAQKQAQDEAEMKALDILAVYFVEAIQKNHRRKRFRKISQDELPWRSQLNLVQGLGHFGVFLQQLEVRDKVLGNKANHMYRTSFLDQEWFTLETAGTLVVGWEGGPSRQVTQHENRGVTHSQQQSRASGIEIAAQAATGKPLTSIFAIPIEEDENISTFRSDMPTKRGKTDKKGKAGEEQAQTTLITADEAEDLMQKTLKYLQRAIILAHRGKHWTLMQNCCRSLWNCVHTALLRTYSADGDGLLNVDELRALAWKPCYLAVDCLLDMVLHLQPDYFDKKPEEMVVSWTGQAESEKGGAALKFEPVLDDTSATDLRWLCRIVLRVIEMLNFEQKWEHLVDVGLRFNAISDSRYAEQVNPLVVQAQRKLIQNIEQSDGVPPPQPHFQKAVQELGKPINGEIYTNLQLKIKSDKEQDPENVKPILKPGSTGLCRVPLDVSTSLNELRQALSKTSYSARSLHHCRKLLVLYLAGQTNARTADSQNSMTSRVEFKPTTGHSQPTMPVDLSKEEFLSIDDVQSSPLSKSQVAVVMTSYEKAIEMLLSNNQRGLAAEAMRELANVHYNMGNMKGAFQWWSEALDMLVSAKNIIKNWRTHFDEQEDISKMLLDKCGMWGCILGAVLSANIAQYLLTSNLGLKTECCFLAGYFFKALFRSSLPHPIADRDYALYEVGEGCEVTYLIPGVDLLSERFRCDGRTLVASLQFVTNELIRGRHHLFVLPLLSLRQYFTTFVCRDLQRCVDTRIRKVKVLTDLGFFADAMVNLTRLLNGERLPQSADSSFRQLESRGHSSQYDTSKPILDPNNIRVLETLLDKRLSSNLSMLYGPHLTCQLSIAQAHLFIVVANTIQELPKFEDGSIPGTTLFVQPHTIATMSRQGSKAGPSMKHGVGETPAGRLIIQRLLREGDEVAARSGKRFTSVKDPVTPAMVKGSLLSTADQILSTLSDIITENAISDKGLEDMSAAELELVIMCKLELSAIAQQRQHSAMAASITLTAMRMLQMSQIFQGKSPSPAMRRASSFKDRKSPEFQVHLVETESSSFQLQNFQSRLRLDARLWLQCRQVLVNSLMGEIKGMGQVKGEVQDVKTELADVRLYCAEGVAEAEACGDVEMKAEFLMQGMLLDMMEGSPAEAMAGLLQEVTKLLKSVSVLSDPGKLLLTWAEVYLTDLQAAVSAKNAEENPSFDMYCKAHQDVLTQMQSLGEQIEHCRPLGSKLHLSTPVSPIKTLYLPHLLLLVQTKLRVAHVMALNVSNTAATKEIANEALAVMWAEPLGVLKTCLEICQVIAMYIPSIEADILLLMGKIQRQLVQLGYLEVDQASATLLKAIEVTFKFDHDLGLIKQAYLELAVLYMVKKQAYIPLAASLSKDTVASATTAIEQESSVAEDASVGKTDSAKSKRKPKGKVKESRAESEISKQHREDDLTKKAWLAVRCAVAVGEAQRSRLLLPGSSDVTSQPVGTDARDNLPEFLLLDLLAGYVLGDKKRVYKDEIEEEMAPLTESLEPPVAETYDDQLIKMRTAASDLSWLHILGYQSVIQRLSNIATLASVKSQANVDTTDGSHTAEVHFNMGYINQSQFKQTLNHAGVRLPLSALALSLRLASVHQFLMGHLPAYSTSCSALYPPKLLYPSSDVTADNEKETMLPMMYKTYGDNRIIPLDVQPDASSESVNAPKRNDKIITTPTDAEVCFQWYLPSLQESPADPMGEASDQQILLLYATNAKKGSNIKASCIWVSLNQLLDLHDRLAVLSQRGEISLSDKATLKKEATPVPAPSKSSKKQNRIKPLSPKVTRDAQLEELLLECMADVQKLFGIEVIETLTPVPSAIEQSMAPAPSSTSLQPSSMEEPAPTPLTQIPFEVTKNNVRNFERLFDPSFGFLLQEVKMINWFMNLFQ